MCLATIPARNKGRAATMGATQYLHCTLGTNHCKVKRRRRRAAVYYCTCCSPTIFAATWFLVNFKVDREDALGPAKAWAQGRHYCLGF